MFSYQGSSPAVATPLLKASVGQPVSQKKILLNYFVPSSFGKIEVGFWVIVLYGPRLLLGRLYYEPLLWFMIDSLPGI